MSKLETGIKVIKEAFQEDFIEKLKVFANDAISNIEERYCVCDHNRNDHNNGEGGSPSQCQDKHCLCNDYHYSLIRSLFHDRDKFLQHDEHAMNYPYIKLLITLQYMGFNSDLLEMIDNAFLWNGDPATEPIKEKV